MSLLTPGKAGRFNKLGETDEELAGLEFSRDRSAVRKAPAFGDDKENAVDFSFPKLASPISKTPMRSPMGARRTPLSAIATDGAGASSFRLSLYICNILVSVTTRRRKHSQLDQAFTNKSYQPAPALRDARERTHSALAGRKHEDCFRVPLQLVRCAPDIIPADTAPPESHTRCSLFTALYCYFRRFLDAASTRGHIHHAAGAGGTPSAALGQRFSNDARGLSGRETSSQALEEEEEEPLKASAVTLHGGASALPGLDIYGRCGPPPPANC